MIRVSKAKVLCPICTKPDWCLVAEDGSAAICTRVEEGSVKKAGTAGWLHIIGEFSPKKYTEPKRPDISWDKWTHVFGRQLERERQWFADFCSAQHLNPITVLRFNVGYHKDWLTIPIYGVGGETTGIQRRQGTMKRFMEHSRMGVFLPSAFLQTKQKVIAVCEGWSDTVTALDYGYTAIGKMNCYVGDNEVVYYAKRSGCERVIIFADNGEVGVDGAKLTSERLKEAGLTGRIIITPREDLRACREAGMTMKGIFRR